MMRVRREHPNPQVRLTFRRHQFWLYPETLMNWLVLIKKKKTSFESYNEAPIFQMVSQDRVTRGGGDWILSQAAQGTMQGTP